MEQLPPVTLERQAKRESQHQNKLARSRPLATKPHLKYSATVWDPHTIKGIQAVEAVQRRAARVTLNDYRGTSTASRSLVEATYSPPRGPPGAYQHAHTPTNFPSFPALSSLPGSMVAIPTVECQPDRASDRRKAVGRSDPREGRDRG
ncbi:hypothetical protein Bbelb_098810 [Branchiostoma belcheri]|nr:hypothetical protein Bbelb_098810 [Branchiostoma belcheri]